MSPQLNSSEGPRRGPGLSKSSVSCAGGEAIRAVHYSEKFKAKMIQKMTDPKGRMAAELTAVINKTLPTILDTLERMGKIREA